MNIASELQAKLKENQRTIYITDADDLLAAWRYKRSSSTKRSKNWSQTPTAYRYSAPAGDKAELMPCHVTYRRKAGQSFSKVKPVLEYSTRSCHHAHGATGTISVPDLDTLETIIFAKQWIAPNVSPILDAKTLALVCKDLGLTGKIIPKVIKGRQYIAFSGYAGLRILFPGTVYSASNMKIIKMGIGVLGLKNMVKGGAVLTICLTVPLTILEAFLKDHTSGYALFGNIFSDLAKIGISSLIGYIAGVAAGALVSYAFAPIAAAIVFGYWTCRELDTIDRNHQLTEKLIVALEKVDLYLKEKRAQIDDTLLRAPHEIEKHIMWKAFRLNIDDPDLGLIK